jgi:hypothetical protein
MRQVREKSEAPCRLGQSVTAMSASPQIPDIIGESGHFRDGPHPDSNSPFIRRQTSSDPRRSPFPCILGLGRLSMKRKPLRWREFIAELGATTSPLIAPLPTTPAAGVVYTNCHRACRKFQ